MEEAIRLIRQQILVCARINELFEALKEVLRKKAEGKALSNAVKRMEAVFSELSGLEDQQQGFLEAQQQRNMIGFVQAQPASVERDVAMRLLSQLGAWQTRLSRQSVTAKELLRHSKEFVDYHMNVLSQAKAESTYGPPGASAADAGRGLKMFDANV